MIDVKDENYHQKENCTRWGSYSEGNPPCTRECKWFVEQELKAQLEQQKKENEELKEKLFQVKDIVEPLNSELPEDKVIREIFLIVNDCINKKVNPYKQALDEIEKKCSKYQTCIIVLKKDILDIINKAKEQK